MSADRTKSLTGIVVIAAGIILLLNNLEVTRINILQYWPVLLIAWGLNTMITGSRSFGAVTVSALVLLLGLALLGRNLDMFYFSLGTVFRFFWPLLIIVIGISIFLGQSMPGKTNWAVMGGLERGKNARWTLDSSSYIAFMGGVDLDLRQAEIPDGETVLDITAIMGGADIRVPADLPVVCDGFAILGGVEFLGRSSGGIIGSTRAEQAAGKGDGKLVKIQGRAVMGGINVKRV